MKIEKRGKYPGVKVHLEPDEVEEVVRFAGSVKTETFGVRLLTKLGKKINTLTGEHPDLLEERTDDQIREVLEGELKAAQEKLALMDAGHDWKKVKK